ncbi:MAG: hypothetical protein AAFV43_13745 [Planctomycetota bacterium]
MRCSVAIAAVMLLVSAVAGAFDVGAPIFLGGSGGTLDVGGTQNRFEIFHESYDRTAEVHVTRFDIGTIAGGPSASAPLFSAEDDVEGGILVGRWIRHWTPRFSTQCDLGVTGLGDSADTALLLGGSARWQIGSTGPIGYAVQVGVNYLPERSEDYAGVDSDGDAFTGFEEFDLFEYGGALLASVVVVQNSHARGTFYTGPRVSAVTGDYTAIIDYPDLGLRGWIDGDLEESEVFGWVLGVHADFNRACNLRVEARVIEEASISVGSSMAF